jgi:hypothetical protein
MDLDLDADVSVAIQKEAKRIFVEMVHNIETRIGEVVRNEVLDQGLINFPPGSLEKHIIARLHDGLAQTPHVCTEGEITNGIALALYRRFMFRLLKSLRKE